MDLSNLYISDFVEKLCLEIKDDNGNLSADDEALNNLQDILTPKEYEQVAQFYFQVHSFDLFSKQDKRVKIQMSNDRKELFKSFEQFIVNTDLPPAYKAGLYNRLIDVTRANFSEPEYYDSLLKKKFEFIEPQKNDREVNRTATQLIFPRNVTDYTYFVRCQKLLFMMKKPDSFSRLAELALPTKQDKKTGTSIIIKPKSMTPEQRNNRLKMIKTFIYNKDIYESFTPRSRIRLLEEGLELAENNKMPRYDNFMTKRDFCKLLGQEYDAWTQYVEKKRHEHMMKIKKYDSDYYKAMQERIDELSATSYHYKRQISIWQKAHDNAIKYGTAKNNQGQEPR